jgi:hypothetical protein
MSLIIGINLSDRVYLSADTRLTFRVDGKDKYLDNILKIKPLSQEIAVTVAGEIDLAAFIVRGLIKSKISKVNIRDFRNSIEELVKSLADGYLKRNHRIGKACFIFAGINRKQKKVIDMHRYVEITKEFQKETGSPMNMKDIIFKGLERKGSGGLVEISSPDSHVFCVQILPQNFIIEDVNWGDFIAYGGGLNKENLPSRFFGQFEVAAKNNELQHDRGWLDIFMKTVAEENNVQTIGGCITSLMISDKISGMLLGGTKRKKIGGIIVPNDEVISEISIINKKLHCLINNERHKLIPFVIYPDMLLKKYPRAEQLIF